jgi:N-sulfoglucosamine sulfohydrolase
VPARPPRAAPRPDPPHIVLLVCHDLGRYLPCYGVGGLETPNLDRLAAEGAVLGRYFAAAPLCSPSRGSIITGCYPHQHGLMGLVNRGWDMPDRTPTLAQRLREAGYATYLFGFQHEKRDARRSGYDHLHHVRGPHRAAEVVPSFVEFLHGAREATRGGPFLAVIGVSEVHRPFVSEHYQPLRPAGVDVPAFLPDRPAVREDLAALGGLVSALDAGVGQVLDALEDTGQDRRTLVVFTTDHGLPFPRAKSTLYDAGLGTALLCRLPGAVPAGRRVDALLSNVDLLPTLLEAAGLPPPQDVAGRSFWSLLRGAAGAGREEVFAEKTWHDAYDPMRAVRTERWKYIRNFAPGPELLLPADIAAAPSATVPEVVAALGRARAEEELYDLAADPCERVNLAADPEHAAVLRGLAARLQAWMEETGDPLLRGPIPDATAPEPPGGGAP